MNKLTFSALLGIVLSVLFSCQNSTQSLQKKKKEAPVFISNTEHSASSVYLTEDEQQVPLMNWVEVDSSDKIHFYFSKLDTTHHTFKAPVSIPIEQNAELHEEGMPKVAVKGDGTLFALYETSISVENSRWGLGDVRYIQSFDQGETWTKPKSVDPEQYANELSSGFANLARLPDGEIGMVWLGSDPELKDGGRPVKFTKTIGQDSLAEIQTIEHKACECCRIGMASGENGEVGIAFRDILPGSIRDISVSFSADNGEGFNAPISFSGDEWKLKGCPHNGPGISFLEGDWHISWFTDGKNHKGVNYAALNDSAQVQVQKHLNSGGHNTQIGTNKHAITAYDKQYKEKDTSYSKIIANKTIGNKVYEMEVSLDKVKAKYPVVQGFNTEQSVVAWNEDNKIFYRIIDNASIDIPVEEMPELISFQN